MDVGKTPESTGVELPFLGCLETRSQPEDRGLGTVTFQDTGSAIPASLTQLTLPAFAGCVYRMV